MKAVNKQALRPYLTMQFPATDETFFAGVYKLPAAHCFTYDLARRTMDVRRYWDADFSDDNSEDFDAYVEECDQVVHESVAAHRIADVKVGSFLSGGVDSSYIAACLMPDNTFSVGFDYQDFNETNYAEELSDKLGIKNFRKMVTADEFFDTLPEIQYHMDEPQSNLSSVPLWFLASLPPSRLPWCFRAKAPTSCSLATPTTKTCLRLPRSSASCRAPSAAAWASSWRQVGTSRAATSC